MSQIATLETNKVFFGGGNKNDVAISYEEYLDVLYCLHDDLLSPETMMRFKNLRQVNMYGMAFVPLFCFPFAYALTYAVLGPVRRGHSGYRNFWTMMSLTLPIASWVGYTAPIPRRLYTDILAANDADGTYIRQRIKHVKPGLWRRISRELHNKRFNFPEMNEYKAATEFPLDFVNPYSQ